MQIKLINLIFIIKLLYCVASLFNKYFKMKKNIIFSIFMSTLIFINCYATAIDLADFTPTLDKQIAKMNSTEEKVKYLQAFSDLLSTPKYTQNKNSRYFKDIREYSLNMLNIFQHELNSEISKYPQNTQTSNIQTSNNSNLSITQPTITNLPHIPDNFTNINEEKIRNSILSWHNNERRLLWLNDYTYNIDLEWTATLRANKIAQIHKTSYLHQRNSSDWYYNYNSMLNWFSGLWIKFPNSSNWASSFSETIWYNTYKCSKSDCTDELINAVKKTRTWLIMKEKQSMWSHYKAATMKHFTQMWAWIAIDKQNNRYYIVLHYGTNF